MANFKQLAGAIVRWYSHWTAAITFSPVANTGLRESIRLLSLLLAHGVKSDYCARLCWQRGMFVIWDNRRTQHLALNGYPGGCREILWVVVKGDRRRGTLTA
ncbi:MAG: hypothetical protein CMQ15_03315 [Gammaproteobacteria bacterium]|nr:hypothetical protein [Gammaproteobacteria bacterium]